MLKKLLLTCLSVALAPLLCEGGYRVWLRVNGQPYEASANRQRMLQIRSTAADTVPQAGEEGERRSTPEGRTLHVPHPYLGFDARNSERQLARDMARTSDDVFEIVVLGGSVANLFGLHGAERLAELLSSDERFRERPIRVLNYARAAFKQPQQVMMLGWLLSMGLEPEAVINIDGFNEVAVALQNVEHGMHPAYPSLVQWLGVAWKGDMQPEDYGMVERIRSERARLLEQADRMLDLPLHWSSIYGRWALAHLQAARARHVEATLGYEEFMTLRATSTNLMGPESMRDFEEALQFAVANWARSSRSLAGICGQHGIPYLHVIQPTLLDEGSKPLTPKEIELGTAVDAWVESVPAGYPLLRAAGAELAAGGENIVDCSRVFADVEEELYFDACHYVSRGSELLAERVAAAFLAALP